MQKDAKGNLVELSERQIVVSENWTKQYLAKYPAKSYFVNPQWGKEDKNEISMVFHVKNQTDKNPYYGRPDSIAAYPYMFIERYTADKTVTISRQDFVSLYMLFSEAASQDSDESKEAFEAMTNAIRQITTLGDGGKSKTLAHLQYPNGGKQPNLEKLDLNRDSEWFRTITETAAKKIITSHNLFPEIIGDRKASNGIGENKALLNVYLLTDANKITPRQKFFSDEWNKVFTAIDKELGTGFAEFQFEFPQNIKKLISSLQAIDTPQTPIANATTN